MPTTRSFIFGKTTNGLAIPAYHFGNSGDEILILAGVHGDETEGITAAHGLLERFQESFPYQLQVTLVPIFNLDGALKCQRQNARGVDLNRNLPTQDWTSVIDNPRYSPGPSPTSESENAALVDYVKNQEPKFIFTLHSWQPMLNINGDCQKVAEAVSSLTGYKITPDIGYPTPGSLGTYCGLERNIPTITYEFAQDITSEDILTTHCSAIIEGLKVLEGR